MVAQISKRKQTEDLKTFDYIKLLCSYIDPKRAQEAFFEGEKSEVGDDDFYAQMKEMDPNFNPEEYKDVLESL